MFTVETVRPYALGLVGFVAGTLFAVFVPFLGSNAERKPAGKFESRDSAAPGDAKAAANPEAKADASARAWDANLYMQIAAEYRACCLQAYKTAADSLRQKMSAAILNEGQFTGKDPAVIIDLDETAIDNSGYQSFQLRNKKSFDNASWELWEQKGVGEVRLVPGAKEFVDLAKRFKVKVFYITNRTQKNKQYTLDALTKLGIEVPSGQLLCNESPTTTDKTVRRDAVASKHEVLLLLGDNLRDFDEKFKSAADGRSDHSAVVRSIQQRKDLVDADRKLWGDKYIILPNPAYGEWAKATGRAERDLELLVPSAKLGD